MSHLQMLEFWAIGWSMLLLGNMAQARYRAHLAAKATKGLQKTMEELTASLAVARSQHTKKESRVVQ